jgi:predicted ATP-binding protein involved in virulence
LKLKILKLTNFKGISAQNFIFDGKNVNIYADNGIGKTTIFDAYKWLLFGKDSLNRSNFGIKPYGKDCKNMTIEVEAEFVNPDIVLKRVYKEKYRR